MPVTARLSKAFYDQLGEQIADELVEWYNQVDATYRSDLERLNEVNFQRFSASLDARVATSEARFEVRLAALESELQQQIAVLLSELQQQMIVLRSDLEQRMARLEATVERRLGEQTRWLFVAWVSLLIPIMGLWLKG